MPIEVSCGTLQVRVLLHAPIQTPMGLLGEGRLPFKEEKRVRNPYGGPTMHHWTSGVGRHPLKVKRRDRYPYGAPTKQDLAGSLTTRLLFVTSNRAATLNKKRAIRMCMSSKG